jgi:small-conductance mechanosensitive channel
MDIQQAFQDWLTSFVEFLPKLVAGIVIFLVTLIASGFIAKWVKKVAKKKISNKEMLQLIFVLTRWSIVIVGTIFALAQVNFDVTGFIAGLGVAGFTIGFALQDIAKNFISGMLLLYRQPFNLGDAVTLGDYTGTVKEINIRDTVIETFSGERVILPNQTVFENPILNFTQTAKRRQSLSIGLGYEEDVGNAIKIFLDVIKNVPGVEVEPKPTVRAEGLGDSALILSALYWIDQSKNDYFGVHSNVITAIKEASEKHNIDLPYPVQTIRLEKVND